MRERRCAFCGDRLPVDAHSSRKFCDDDCKAGVVKAPEVGTVVAATEKAIEAADHLTDMDAGAVAALRVLARKLDDLAGEQVESLEDLKAKFDNVTIPTYLKYCESLGLTPAGRGKLAEKKPEAKGGKLRGLKSVPKPA